MNVAIAIFLFVVAAVFSLGAFRYMGGANPMADYRRSMYLPSIIVTLGLAVAAVVGGIVLLV